MVNPILPNPDDTEQTMVMEFEQFIQSHWFFNGKITPKQIKVYQTKIDDQQRGENID